MLLLALGGLPYVEAQERTGPPEGWQGPWPTPQKAPPKPAPQPPSPAGQQILEIPPQMQQSNLPPARQQLEIPSRLQPESPRPTQLLTVTVTDAQGRYVPGLQPDDFLVYEEDLPQQITYFATGQEEPVSLGFLVDTSGSMLNKIGRARHALIRFFQSIRPRDEVFLEAFNRRPVALQDFTDNRALLEHGASLLEPFGDTALYDAILDGLRRVKQGRRQKRALVLLTDGLDTASAASLDDALSAVRRGGVTMYTIGIGTPIRGGQAPGMGSHQRPFPGGGRRHGGLGWPGLGMPGMGLPMPPLMGRRGGGSDDSVDVRVLQTLSSETGGRHFVLNTSDVASNQAVLDLAVQTISDELRQQYTVGYKSPLRGDVHRSVRVEVRRPGLAARTQKGTG
ncbi:MAG TPA: VWA domain-containing protein [Methylomirabilota bacterium]|nr:VWA domain-containing protein [Methylomirabilota bacterium]